jgi:hypothetical protein
MSTKKTKNSIFFSGEKCPSATGPKNGSETGLSSLFCPCWGVKLDRKSAFPGRKTQFVRKTACIQQMPKANHSDSL